MIAPIEMARITPPVGLNLYVVQATRRSGLLPELIQRAVPSVRLLIAMTFDLPIALPNLAPWLPAVLGVVVRLPCGHDV